MPWIVPTVFEIGPGPGGLTRALLLEGAPQVIAVERDDRCLFALAPLADAAEGRLILHPGDALEIDFAALAPAPWQVSSEERSGGTACVGTSGSRLAPQHVKKKN